MKLMSGMQEQFEKGKALEANTLGVLCPESFEEARLLCSAVLSGFDARIDRRISDLYKSASNSKTLLEMRYLVALADTLLVNQGQICTDGCHNWGLREFLDIPPAGNYDGISDEHSI